MGNKAKVEVFVKDGKVLNVKVSYNKKNLPVSDFKVVDVEAISKKNKKLPVQNDEIEVQG